MTYDIAVAAMVGSPNVHQSPLKDLDKPRLSLDGAFRFLHEVMEYPAKRIIVGAPSYGRGWAVEGFQSSGPPNPSVEKIAEPAGKNYHPFMYPEKIDPETEGDLGGQSGVVMAYYFIDMWKDGCEKGYDDQAEAAYC